MSVLTGFHCRTLLEISDSPVPVDAWSQSFFFTTSEPLGLSPRSASVDNISAAVNILWGNGCKKKVSFLFINTCYSFPAGNMQERSSPSCQGMGNFFRFSCYRAEAGVGKGAEQSKKTLSLSYLINLPFSYNTFFSLHLILPVYLNIYLFIYFYTPRLE